MPATAHWWFSFYSTPCGSLLRTSAEKERGVKGGEVIWGKAIVIFSECNLHLALRICRGFCVGSARLQDSSKSLFLFSEGRGCTFLWGCFSAPNLTGPSLDPNSLPATKWPQEGQDKVLGEKEPGSRQEKARLPK